MRNIFRFILICAGILLFACAKPENPQNETNTTQDQNGHTVVGVIGESFVTKTTLENNLLSWSTGDMFEMYAGKSTFLYELTEDGKTFRSQNTPVEIVQYAAYPAEDAIWSAAGLTIKLPSERMLSDKTVIPMVAEIGKSAVDLKEVTFAIPVGLVSLTCDVPVGYNSLIITSADKKIGGTFLYEDNKLLPIETSTPNKVLIKFDSPAQKTAMTFHLPVPPAEYESLNFKLAGENDKELQITEVVGLTVEKARQYIHEVKSDLSISFGEITESDLIFPYSGGTKDYPVYSDVEWKPVSTNPNVVVNKKDASTLSITMPAGKSFGGLSSEVKVMSEDPAIIIAPAIMAVSQEANPDFSPAAGSDISYDENGYAIMKISPEVGKSLMNTPGKGKYGTYTIEIAESDLNVGMISLCGWGENVNIQCQIGLYNRVYFDDSKYGDKNNKFYFNSNMSYKYEDLKKIRKIQLKLYPVFKDDSQTEKVMCIQMFFDEIEVLNVKTKNETFQEEDRGGFSFSFGLETRTGDQPETIPSSVIFKSYTYSTSY